MASNEAENSSKSPKKTSAQEQPSVASSAPATPVYADWSNFQAYSPVPPHGFFPSAVASSPQAHPYMWGAQPMMPPYGTPPPYVMYPPGGIYGHPAMPPGSHPFSPYAMPAVNGNAEAPNGQETDRKSSEGKEKSPIKRSKGSLGSLNMITGKNNGTDPGKTSGTSANGVSHSDSGTESSSEGSDDNSQNDSTPKASGGEEPYGGSGRSSENGMARTPSQAMLNQSTAVVSVAAGPTTNLNIGMDYWGSPGSTAGAAAIHVKAPVSNTVVPSEHWIQDERELKKQRRKQSNRESARRSRLRKQAECEELAQRADALKQENAALRAEVERIRKEYDDLLSQNSSLKEKLGQVDPNSDETRSDRNDENPENHN